MANRKAPATQPTQAELNDALGDDIPDAHAQNATPTRKRKTFAELAPERITTSTIVDRFGTDPFCIIWLSGEVEHVTFRGTNTPGEVMQGTIQAIEPTTQELTGPPIPVAFTGAALVNGLKEVTQGKTLREPFDARIRSENVPGSPGQKMWRLF